MIVKDLFKEWEVLCKKDDKWREKFKSISKANSNNEDIVAILDESNAIKKEIEKFLNQNIVLDKQNENYKDMWDEEKHWLNKSINYLKTIAESATNEERIRLFGKLDGFKTLLQHMNDSERLNNN